MVEEAEYTVTLEVRLTSTVGFSPIERDRPLLTSDAIEIALSDVQDLVKGEGFTVTLIAASAAKES